MSCTFSDNPSFFIVEYFYNYDHICIKGYNPTFISYVVLRNDLIIIDKENRRAKSIPAMFLLLVKFNKFFKFYANHISKLVKFFQPRYIS